MMKLTSNPQLTPNAEKSLREFLKDVKTAHADYLGDNVWLISQDIKFTDVYYQLYYDDENDVWDFNRCTEFVNPLTLLDWQNLARTIHTTDFTVREDIADEITHKSSYLVDVKGYTLYCMNDDNHYWSIYRILPPDRDSYDWVFADELHSMTLEDWEKKQKFATKGKEE